jgi:hypothetical protein
VLTLFSASSFWLFHSSFEVTILLIDCMVLFV